MRYLIISAEYNSEAMADEPCENCEHTSTGYDGTFCLESNWTDPPNSHLETCDCGLEGRPTHKVAKSDSEPIASIVSLRWLTHSLTTETGEPIDGLELTEDDTSEYAEEGYASYHRKWSGEVTEATWQALVSEWGIEIERSEPNMGTIGGTGWNPSFSFSYGGEEWNSGGWSPIAFVDLRVEPTEQEARNVGLEHFGLADLPLTHTGRLLTIRDSALVSESEAK